MKDITGSLNGQALTMRIKNLDYICYFDGTLYNSKELRREIADCGENFADKANRADMTDAETALLAYCLWGGDCAKHFDGMFALAILNGPRLFMARDQLGVKPLFYYIDADGLAFASNLKQLRVPAVIGRESIYELLLLGPGRTPGSGILSGVRSLLPGECAAYSREAGLQRRQYFNFTAEPHTQTFEETAATVKELLTDSIKRQTVSSEPVCSFLSGGLDSSAIAALSGVNETFSVDYADNDLYFTPDAFQPEGDDPFIQTVSEFLGTRHTKIILSTEELAAALGSAVTARGLPGMADVDASLLLFSRRVRERFPVALSGECADELFGGYPWYRDESLLWEDAFPWSRKTAYRVRFINPEIAGLAECEEFVHSHYNDAVKQTDFLKEDSPTEKRMRQMFTLNVGWFGQTLLERHNSMTGFAGLEARVPFCDARLAAYAFNIPWEFKNYMGREKGLLREAFRGLLPDGVLWRKKSPYPKTQNPRYLEIVSGMLREIISDPNAPLLEIVNLEAVKGLLSGGDDANRWYGQLMTRPQTIAYFWQINEWMKQLSVRVSV